MPSLYLLAGVVALTLMAAGVELFRRSRVHSSLQELATIRRMHFSPYDPLRLTARVAANLPIPGAAYVRVIDLMYGTDGSVHRYVFTAEYTVGVVRSKKRVRRAATFTEPRDRSAAMPTSPIRLASADLTLLEQYESLLG